MKLLIMQSSPVSCYLVPVTPEYLRQHNTLMVKENNSAGGGRLGG
jgi:hypothetical protein